MGNLKRRQYMSWYRLLLIAIIGTLVFNFYPLIETFITSLKNMNGSFIVRAKPCLPLWSFSLIRKTELWKTNKPPAMQVSQHCFSLQKKPPVV